MDISTFYVMPTKVGPVGSDIDGVKIGKSTNAAFERTRAYNQPGVIYTMSVWRGLSVHVSILENLFVQKHDFANMNRTFPGVSQTEVFIGELKRFLDSVDSLINEYKLEVKFHIGNYSCTNKGQHTYLINQNPEPVIADRASKFYLLDHVPTKSFYFVDPTTRSTFEDIFE